MSWFLRTSDDHAGECCGRVHIFDFDTAEGDLEDSLYPRRVTFADRAKAVFETVLNEWDSERPPRGNGGRGVCVEAVLIDQQMKKWSRPLNACGFRRVLSFVNKNSGNTCHVYLLDTSKLKNPVKEKKGK